MGNAKFDQLNAFLRGEIAAVETYRMAMDKIASGSATRGVLEENRRSHQARVKLLRDEIVSLGGQPAVGSGVWGTWAKVVEGGAKILGDKAAVAALEDGEDHGLKEYRFDGEDLDPAVKTLVRGHLLPQQEQTHRRMSDLKKALRT